MPNSFSSLIDQAGAFTALVQAAKAHMDAISRMYMQTSGTFPQLTIKPPRKPKPKGKGR